MIQRYFANYAFDVDSWRSLRLFRKRRIGFPQRGQRENCDQKGPATISFFLSLMTFLQRSHLVMSIWVLSRFL